jgi:hypothetical protein
VLDTPTTAIGYDTICNECMDKIGNEPVSAQEQENQKQAIHIQQGDEGSVGTIKNIR